MRVVKTPFLGPNDIEARLAGWNVEPGEVVKDGDVVASLETTKAVIEIVADAAGFLYHLAAANSVVQQGQPLAVLSETRVDDPARLAGELLSTGTVDPGANVTKKAQILIRRHGLDAGDLARHSGSGSVTESVVAQYLEDRRSLEKRRGLADSARVAVIGGVSGGGALIVVEALLRSPSAQAVCIFETDTALHGRSVLGVPVAGTLRDLDAWLSSGRIDAVVIAFNRDLAERASTFEDLRSKGVPFCNVIDPTADIRTGVVWGTGNVLLGRVYLGACSQLGDNNFISANVCLEHGNVLGSHNAFGPGVFTSGNVTVGDRVRFATGIFVEPGITIGSDSVIASGSILTVDVEAGTTVKGRREIRPRQDQ